MSRLPLYIALAVALCFGASASFATPIRMVLAAGDSMDTTPTPTADLGVEEDEELFIVTETRSNGVVEMATATGSSSTGPRNRNILRTSQGQSAGVALTLGRAIDNNLDDSSSGGSRLAQVASGPSNAGSPYNDGDGEDGTNGGGGDPPADEPPHMPEPTAAALFALGVWVAGRRTRR